MYYLIFLTLLIWQLFNGFPITSTANVDNGKEICPYQYTVNLTNCKSYENGSYIYQGIIIPIEKQHYYIYDVKFLNKMLKVPKHLRGCVCEEKPCIKLCCNHDEYFDESSNTSKCEKLMSEIKVSWTLPIQLKNGIIKEVDLLKHFTTQIGLPCQDPEAFDLKLDKYLMKEDGNLYIGLGNSTLNTLDYCYSPVLNEEDDEYIFTPYSCSVLNIGSQTIIINSYAMGISVIFLIPTILVYLVLKELRGNQRGKLVIFYLFSMTVGYVIICLINTSQIIFTDKICKFLGFTCYFFFMSAYLWLSVLCYDICRNFKETNIELKSKGSHMQFIIYCLYVWLSAGLATGIVIYIQLYTDFSLKPGIGDENCWLHTKKWSAAIYFYGPNLVILILNLATFIHITIKIYKVRRNIARATNNETFFQENAIVICRLFLIMGISWIFDILSYSLRNYEESKFLFTFADFFNAIQGLLIFLLFIIKPNVLNLLRNRFFKKQIARPQNNCNTIATNVSKSSTSVQGNSTIETLSHRMSTYRME